MGFNLIFLCFFFNLKLLFLNFILFNFIDLELPFLFFVMCLNLQLPIFWDFLFLFTFLFLLTLLTLTWITAIWLPKKSSYYLVKDYRPWLLEEGRAALIQWGQGRKCLALSDPLGHLVEVPYPVWMVDGQVQSWWPEEGMVTNSSDLSVMRIWATLPDKQRC